jgi:hypothetical protein
MSYVILQPTADPYARRNYQLTVESTVSLSVIQPHVTESTLNELTLSAEGGGVRVWGVGSVHITPYTHIRRGDVVLFARDKRFFSEADIIQKTESQTLATKLWGDPTGSSDTWPLIYFLTSPVKKDIAYPTFKEIVGYTNVNGNPAQGFTVLDQTRNQRYHEYEYEAAYQAIDSQEPLDTVTKAMARREQSALRRQLIGDKSEVECGICGRTLPVHLLVAAHIKKRSACTPDEKRNIPFIAMPICNLGCDPLYELGYVTVVNGIVQVAETSSVSLQNILRDLSGKRCKYWVEERRPYFDWHHQWATS